MTDEQLFRMHLRLQHIGAAVEAAMTRDSHIRLGQAFFNALTPAMQELVRATDVDPFHDDARVVPCIARILGHVE